MIKMLIKNIYKLKYLYISLLAIGISCTAMYVQAQDRQNDAVAIENAWARASIGNSPVTAIYMDIANPSTVPDKLLKVSSADAMSLEMHDTVITHNIARMQPLPYVIIPAGQTISFKPGAKHIMVMGLKKPLKKGEKLKVTYTFERRGAVMVEVVAK